MTGDALPIKAGDQYMSIVLPGRMYREIYKDKGIAPQMLSRQIKDTGTITSPLVSWNSRGAYMSATLGVATMAYLSFCFFNWINVIVSFGNALLGFQIKRLAPEEEIPVRPKEAMLYGVGGHRVEPTEYELAVTEG